MLLAAGLLSLLALCHTTSACNDLHSNPATIIGTNATGLTLNSIPYSTRVHWMRFANGPALNSPCPFAPFGAIVVNHTAPGLGELVCIGQNNARTVGNPTHHGESVCLTICNRMMIMGDFVIGEIVAISNCTEILQAPPYNLTPSGATAALKDLSLYTNAESCPMVSIVHRQPSYPPNTA